MNDVLPSLVLLAAGGWFLYTARHPEHANPKAARAMGVALLVVGAGALIYSLLW